MTDKNAKIVQLLRDKMIGAIDDFLLKALPRYMPDMDVDEIDVKPYWLCRGGEAKHSEAVLKKKLRFAVFVTLREKQSADFADWRRLNSNEESLHSKIKGGKE